MINNNTLILMQQGGQFEAGTPMNEDIPTYSQCNDDESDHTVNAAIVSEEEVISQYTQRRRPPNQSFNTKILSYKQQLQNNKMKVKKVRTQNTSVDDQCRENNRDVINLVGYQMKIGQHLANSRKRESFTSTQYVQ